MKTSLFLLLLAGCALTPPPKPAEAPLGPGEVRSVKAAESILGVGKNTKAEVRAALGEAIVVDFASGYEVWVYRERSAAELVLLFDRGGILTKARTSASCAPCGPPVR